MKPNKTLEERACGSKTAGIILLSAAAFVMALAVVSFMTGKAEWR